MYDMDAPSKMQRDKQESILKWFKCPKRSHKKKKIIDRLLDSSDHLSTTIDEQARLIASLSVENGKYEQDLKDSKCALMKAVDEKSNMEVEFNSSKDTLDKAQSKLQSTQNELKAMANQQRDLKTEIEKLKKERNRMGDNIRDMNTTVSFQTGKMKTCCALLKQVKKENYHLKFDLGATNECLKYDVEMLTRELKKKEARVRKLISDKLLIMSYYQDRLYENQCNPLNSAINQDTPYKRTINQVTQYDGAIKQGMHYDSTINERPYDNAVNQDTPYKRTINQGTQYDSAIKDRPYDNAVNQGTPHKRAISQITYGPRDFDPQKGIRCLVNVAHEDFLQNKILDQEWHLYRKQQLIDELAAIILDYDPNFSIETTPELEIYLDSNTYDTCTGTTNEHNQSVQGDDADSYFSRVNGSNLGMPNSPKQDNSFHFDALSSGSTSVPPCSSQSNISGDTDTDVRDYVSAVMASAPTCSSQSNISGDTDTDVRDYVSAVMASAPTCSSQSNISGDTDTDVRDYVSAVMASPNSCDTMSTSESE